MHFKEPQQMLYQYDPDEKESFVHFKNVFRNGALFYGEDAHDHYHKIMEKLLRFDIRELYQYRKEFIDNIKRKFLLDKYLEGLGKISGALDVDRND